MVSQKGLPASGLPAPAVPEVELEQGGSAFLTSTDQQRAYQVFVGAFYQYVEIWCTDLPGGWLDLAEVDLSRYSQPTCKNDLQCAPGQFCDATLGRCLQDLCVGIDTCVPGQVCDPYKGFCMPNPPEPCGRDSECPYTNVCNPKTERCVSDVCQVMDCLGGCSSLLGVCYECLHDDDCWPGLCKMEDHTCLAACRNDKLDFVRPNPQRYDRFIACVDEALEDQATALMQKYLGDVNFTPATAADPCDGLTERTCQGPLELLDGDGSIARDQWFGLCALSRLDVVHSISGSHSMP